MGPALATYDSYTGGTFRLGFASPIRAGRTVQSFARTKTRAHSNRQWWHPDCDGSGAQENASEEERAHGAAFLQSDEE